MDQRTKIIDTHGLLATAATPTFPSMEADAMPQGPIPPSPLSSATRPLPSPCFPSRMASTTPPQILAHRPTSPIGGDIASRPSPTEQGGQEATNLGKDAAGSISMGQDLVASSKKKGKKGTKLSFWSILCL